MKLSEKQKDLISKISSEISGWASTNDIDSPSNWTLIEEFCESLEFTEKKELALNQSLDEIFSLIKGLQ